MQTERNAFAGQRQWRLPWAFQLSFALHAAAFLCVILWPAAWPYWLGLVVLNHMCLSLAVLWPRGRVLGPNLSRLPAAAAARGEVVLTFDDGPDLEITPRVLDILERHQARASFFVIGNKVHAHPELLRDIVRRGHSVENHSYRHPYAFPFFGMAQLKREVDRAQLAIRDILGVAPQYFRAPVGLRSPLLDDVLARRGLHYVSWSRRGYDGVVSDAQRVMQKLTQGLAAGDILLLHDRSHADGTQPAVLEVLPRLLELMRERGLRSVSLPMALRDSDASEGA